MNKLIFLLAVLFLLVPMASHAQTHTFCPTDATCTWTGPQTFNGPVSIPGNVSVGGTLGAGATTVSSLINSGNENLTGTFIQATNGAVEMDINHSIFSTAPNGVFPLGGDININCRGSCDLVLAHTAAKATASSTLNVGLNSNVLLANISPTASLLTSFTPSVNAAWVVGRDTPNEEFCTPVTIVDATHVNITCAKTHTINGVDNNSKPLIDIEQGIGNTDNKVDGGGGITFSSISPSQELAATHPMVRVQGSDNVPYMLLPSSQSDTFPRNAVNFDAPLTGTGTIGAGGGQLPTANDLFLVNADSSHCVRLQNSARSVTNFSECDTANTFGAALVDATAGGTPAQSGAIRLLNAHGIAWRGSGAFDLSFGVNAADGLAFNTAAVVGTVPYNVGVANLTAQSASVGPTTIRAVAANQAGMFRISWSAVVTTAATTSSTLGGATTGFQVTYTDNDTGAAVTTPLAAAPAAGTNTAYSQTNSQNTVGAQASGVVIVNAKASTNIQYNFGYTSVGATVMQYALHIRIEPI